MFTSIIIEPRQPKALSFVLNNFLENLSNDWVVLIMHGNKNINFLNNIIKNDLEKYQDRIILENLNIDNLTIYDYNQLLYSNDFYNKIPTETFLVFQTDTIICKNSKDLINEFLSYDYVGAPWKNPINGEYVGNGGLSLRKKSKMLNKINKCTHTNITEDVFFSNNNCEPLYKPDKNKANIFSNEQVFEKQSFGVHKPWLYLTEKEINYKISTCDGLDKLIKLNQ